MKILKLEIKGFRSFQSQVWYPGDLNVVIGPNGSGKSNLLALLEMIADGACGDLSEYVQREGGMQALLWDGKADGIGVRLTASPALPYRDESRHSLTYELEMRRVGKSGGYRIEKEVLGNFCEAEQGATVQPVKLLERGPGLAVIHPINELGLRISESAATTSYQGSSSQQDDSTRASLADSIGPEEPLLAAMQGPFAPNHVAVAFREGLASWTVHPWFHAHRGAEVRQATVARFETRIQPDGDNLIAVLHTLYTSDREFKSEINTAMKAAFGEEFEELVFPPAADQRIQLRVRWKSLTREVSAADLSDGTLRFLFLLAVLANPKPPALIAIDEPETGLHPSMLRIVAEYARDAASRTQVVLTTHSPEFLDAFGDEPPTTTVVEWQDGQTQLRVLAGDSLDYWLKQYSLGELYRSWQLEAMA